MKGNKLFLYTPKTGTPVYVPLPPAAVKALGQLDEEGEYFFTSGKAKPQTARANWSRYLDTVFSAAKVKDAHSHRFRDQLLRATIADCSGGLGRLARQDLR